MTVSSTANRTSLFNSPGIGPFAFAFKVFQAADLMVIRADEYGVETTLTLTTDYTVSLNADQNNNPGGSVTLVTALVAGEELLIMRVIEALQETDIQNMSGFYPEVLEDALDRLTMLVQQQQEELDRSLKIDPTSGIVPEDLLTALATGGDGFVWKGAWAAATAYAQNNLVHYGGSTYICATSHTSADFATELAAGVWELLASQGASGAGTGDMLKADNLSGMASAATSRSNINAAKSGVNSDITEIAGLTTPLSVAQGGTGSTTGSALTGVLSKSGGYTVATSDRGKLIDCTASLTLTLPAAATAGNGFVIAVRNSANLTDVTIDPDGSETINGASTLVLGPFASALVVCTGTAWLAVRGSDIPSQRNNAGKVLGTTGSALEWVGGDWVRIQDNVAISAVASIDLTLDTSTYSDFILVVTDARPATNGQALLGKPLYGAAQLTTLNGGVNDLTTGLETNKWPYLIGGPASYQVGSSYNGSCVARISGASGANGGGVSVSSSSTGRQSTGVPFACECSSYYQWDGTGRVMTGIRMVWTGGNFTANGTYSLFGLKR